MQPSPIGIKKPLLFADDSQKGIDPLGIEPRTFRALIADHSDVKRTLMRILDLDINIVDVGCNILIPLDHESFILR